MPQGLPVSHRLGLRSYLLAHVAPATDFREAPAKALILLVLHVWMWLNDCRFAQLTQQKCPS
jgi:hypothetical protein